MTSPASQSVVLVDDDNFLLQMYAMKFTKEGFTVNAFHSSDDALEALRKGLSAQAIVFDLTMPGHDGYAFLEMMAAEKLGEGATKIALSNQSSDAEKAKAIELGADLFIVKASMIPSEVVNMVRDAITHKKSA